MPTSIERKMLSSNEALKELNVSLTNISHCELYISKTCNLSNNLYNVEENLFHPLFSSHMISERKNSNTLVLIFTIGGGVSTSPYTIFKHVNLLTFIINFKINLIVI